MLSITERYRVYEKYGNLDRPDSGRVAMEKLASFLYGDNIHGVPIREISNDKLFRVCEGILRCAKKIDNYSKDQIAALPTALKIKKEKAKGENASEAKILELEERLTMQLRSEPHDSKFYIALKQDGF